MPPRLPSGRAPSAAQSLHRGAHAVRRSLPSAARWLNCHPFFGCTSFSLLVLLFVTSCVAVYHLPLLFPSTCEVSYHVLLLLTQLACFFTKSCHFAPQAIRLFTVFRYFSTRVAVRKAAWSCTPRASRNHSPLLPMLLCTMPPALHLLTMVCLLFSL